MGNLVRWVFTYTPELVSELASVRAASVWLDGVFAAERLEGETCDVCLLLLDELVANAVKHGRGGVGVRVDVRDPIRVEVTNRGTEGTVAPIPYERGRPAEHFGLHVVHGLASELGSARGTPATPWSGSRCPIPARRRPRMSI